MKKLNVLFFILNDSPTYGYHLKRKQNILFFFTEALFYHKLARLFSLGIKRAQGPLTGCDEYNDANHVKKSSLLESITKKRRVT